MSEIEQRRNEVLQLSADTKIGAETIQQQDNEVVSLRKLLGRQEAAANEIQEILGALITKAEALVAISREAEEQSKVVYQRGANVVETFGGLVGRGEELLDRTDNGHAESAMTNLHLTHGSTNLAGLLFDSLRHSTERTRESSAVALEAVRSLERRLGGIEADAIEASRMTDLPSEHYANAKELATTASTELTTYASEL